MGKFVLPDELEVPEHLTEDVALGSVADEPHLLEQVLPDPIFKKFDIYSYRSAGMVLAQSHPRQFRQIVEALDRFEISETMIRTPGGSKGPIARYMDTLLDSSEWKETRISADLHVKLHHSAGGESIREYVRKGYLDGHRIDFLSGRVAFDFEWNSKDQTYDRDLYAFAAFYAAGAIDVGIILTRGMSLDNHYFRKLGKVLTKDGKEGTSEVYKKFGASTTWMKKLLYRLDAGRNGGCPVLAVGITPRCVVD